jgi:hypothetical protein
MIMPPDRTCSLGPPGLLKWIRAQKRKSATNRLSSLLIPDSSRALSSACPIEARVAPAAPATP